MYLCQISVELNDHDEFFSIFSEKRENGIYIVRKRTFLLDMSLAKISYARRVRIALSNDATSS
jgi:hypothetical protein